MSRINKSIEAESRFSGFSRGREEREFPLNGYSFLGDDKKSGTR